MYDIYYIFTETCKMTTFELLHLCPPACRAQSDGVTMYNAYLILEFDNLSQNAIFYL